MKYTLEEYSLYELGKRKNQEDAMFPAHGTWKEKDRLFILCDGMGGHEAGEVASQTVCKAMSESVLEHCPEAEGHFSDPDLQRALQHAFDALDAQNLAEMPKEKKMGTTMTFLKFHEEGVTVAHIGDSRVYHIRPGKNQQSTRILFQTEDHSLVNDLLRIGEISREEAKHFQQKNVITRAMQPAMERRPKADLYHTDDLLPGDYFMMCSDGVLEQMEEENLKYIFSDAAGDAEKKLEMLRKVTADNNDNHSAIIVHVLDVEKRVDRKEQNGEEQAGTDVAAECGNGEVVNKGQEKPEFPKFSVEEEDNPPTRRAKMKYFLLFIVFAIICFAGYWFFKMRG